jgi:hypothetical protein
MTVWGDRISRDHALVTWSETAANFWHDIAGKAIDEPFDLGYCRRLAGARRHELAADRIFITGATNARPALEPSQDFSLARYDCGDLAPG